MKITASYSRTVQVRQYEPARVIATVEEESGDRDPTELYRELFELCRVLVNEPIAEIHKHSTKFRERD